MIINDMNYLKKVRFHLLVIPILLINISCENSQVLFQENANNWKSYGDAIWSFSGNELIGKISDGTGYVMTDQTYSDFVLELEFKPDDTINSGVYMRCKHMEISATNCYEVNIWDLHPNQDYRTGSIVGKAVPLVKVETNNKWNTYEIRVVKDHVQVWINDALTVDLIDETRTDGYIALQAAGTGEIRFRNLKISPLKAD